MLTRLSSKSGSQFEFRCGWCVGQRACKSLRFPTHFGPKQRLCGEDSQSPWRNELVQNRARLIHHHRGIWSSALSPAFASRGGSLTQTFAQCRVSRARHTNRLPREVAISGRLDDAVDRQVTADWARFSCFASLWEASGFGKREKIRIRSRISESSVIGYIDRLDRNLITISIICPFHVMDQAISH